MIKIISSEEYAKLTGDVDYWKTRALQEERMKRFLKTKYNDEYSKNQNYYEKYIESVISNDKLKQKIKELEKAINNEYYCDRNCFEEHVLPAIQRDYDSIDSKNGVAKYLFINYWYDNLLAFYPWLKRLYSINGKIRFK